MFQKSEWIFFETLSISLLKVVTFIKYKRNNQHNNMYLYILLL